jgi:hypothetical protein
MRVRFLTSIASPSWSFAPGQEGDIPDTQALALIESGIAEPVKAGSESGTLFPNSETASIPPARKKRG